MAIIFPDPSLQTPVNTFSPTSTPDATTNGLTYIWDNALGVWTSSAGGGGGGGVTGVTVTAPITDTGTPTAPVIGISAATNAAAGSVQLATAAEAAAGTSTTKVLTPSDGVPKVLADMTGAAIIPGGDDTERAAITTPTDGMLRYNDTTAPSVMEYYDGTQWVDLATGASGWVPLATINAVAASTVDFTSVITSAYSIYAIGISKCVMGDGDQLGLQFSTNNGSTFDSANNYLSTNIQSTFTSDPALPGNGVSRVTITSGSGGGPQGFVYIYDPLSSTTPACLGNFQVSGRAPTGATITLTRPSNTYGSFLHAGTTPRNAIRLLPSGGTVTGTFTLYGIANL